MIREVKFESQDRRIKQIIAALNENGIKDIEEANAICEAAGLDPYKTCEETQPICFENAKWAYVVGTAIALKKNCTNAAEAAEAIGKLTATDVIPRPIRPIGDVVSIYDVDTQCDEELLEPGAIRTEALGMIETFGIVFCIEAADAMCKAADVEMIGFENTASGYISVLVEGDVGACKTAVEAGIKAVEAIGHEVYSSTVIARPHEGLKKITCQYSLDKLLPYPAE